jgi:ATP-dependent DNA helicase DinG
VVSDAEVASALERVTAALPGGGESRPGQVEMAVAVARAVRGKRHLIVQAGTGTGKSLAYLVPAVLSGRKCVVATATKALQDQLAGRDLPFLEEHLGPEFSYALLKGRSNYLCLQRAKEVAGGDQLELEDSGEVEGVGELGRQVRRLLSWGATSATGDRAELEFEPRPAAWSAVSVASTECPGAARCPSGTECFAERARRQAEEADVVVVNTHLYGAHLASGQAILPEHEVVIFDEAHELEDVAATSLGFEIGPGRLRALARNARALLTGAAAPAADAVADSADRLDAILRTLPRQRLSRPLDPELADLLVLAGARVTTLTSAVREVDEDSPARARVLQAAGHLSADLALLGTLGPDQVAWVEEPERAPLIKVGEVDVAGALSERLWEGVTGVLASATIPPHLATRVGLPAERTDQIDVGSPFPYEANGLLYCATHLPDPRRPEAEAAVHEELAWLIEAAGGRTLALFTSWRAMRAAVDALRPRLPFRILSQSDLPKPALLAQFAGDETSCLFATMGFWQGVDVPGRSLTLVTIDRLAFPRPDEPLMQARRDRAGEAAFRLVDLPRAATLLAQGAGRLIRSGTDRGVVAVLDPRLASAGYRWELVNALPPMKRTRHRAEVEQFLTRVLDEVKSPGAPEHQADAASPARP